MKTVALHNLGCKVNAYELEVIEQKFIESGYKIVPFDQDADIYVINTCTVTNIADRKSRQMIHRAKTKNPNAVVVAMGCYVQTAGEKALMDESIDLAVGNNRKKDLIRILEAWLREREEGTMEELSPQESKTLHHTSIIEINKDQVYEEMELSRCSEHTRAYIKIQDGCNQFCSYCIIPYARGRVRSRKQKDVLNEIRGLAAKGYKEVVLTGIHISSYGMDFIDSADGDYLANGKDLRGTAFERAYLLNLIKDVAALPGIERVRLGSLEPRIITRQFVEELAKIPEICPHFHLSLQSGCTDTLKRMNRHYTADEYKEKVEILRGGFEHPAITTDVIVGFPQETETEFEICRQFLQDVDFFELHVFKYSVRQGTVAAKMQGQVPEPVKTARSAVLLNLDRELSREFRAYYLGKEICVLAEDTVSIGGHTYRTGLTPQYVRAAFPVGEEQPGDLVLGTVSGFLTDEILLMELK